MLGSLTDTDDAVQDTVVTRERSISSTTAAASNVRCTIVVAPTAIIVVVTRSS